VSDVLIGTTGGVFRWRDGGLEPLGLESERVTALHATADGTILAGTYGDGLLRSEDGGRTWSHISAGLTASAFRFLAADPRDDSVILAGTEPARVFRSRDGGLTWCGFAGIERIDGHERWFLPYSPRAGAARNIHLSPARPDRLLASVEVGGLLRSDDGGTTWTCQPIGGDEDVHLVTGHPDDPDLLWAALGSASLAQGAGRHGGIARSRDGGGTWEKVEDDYTRAVLVPPAQPDLVLAGPAPQVGHGGRIVVSRDGGDTWQPAGTGVEIPMSDMVELFVPAPGGSVWAICSRGRLLRAMPGEWEWSPAIRAGGHPPVKSVAFAR